MRRGDPVDFWRVEVVDDEMEPMTLRLRAEMKAGGRAWLQYEVSEPEDGNERAEDAQAFVTQTAFFEPRGLIGLLYWYALYVPHRFIFTGMIEELGRRAELLEARSENGRVPDPTTKMLKEMTAA
jgi:hypothetical protein